MYVTTISQQVSRLFIQYRVSGDSMTGAGIHNGDLLIVDRSIEPTSGRVVIAVLNGERTVKRLHSEGDRLLLLAENANYPPIEVSELEELHVFEESTLTFPIQVD
jgi:DNA polymerase V